MATRSGETGAREAAGALSARQLAERRSSGMHAIRFEFALRLLRNQQRVDTLSIFWEHDPGSLTGTRWGEGSWKLVLASGGRVTTEFPDRWVLGYPDDADARRSVDAALDEMVAEARGRSADDARARLRQALAARNAQSGPGAPSPNGTESSKSRAPLRATPDGNA